MVWANSTNLASNQSALQKAQQLGLVMVAPMRQNTPTKGLEIVLGVQPLHLRVQELAMHTYNRLDRSPDDWRGKKGKRLGHLKWLEKLSKDIPHQDRQDRCVKHKWERQFSVAIEEGKDNITIPGL
jgi:hypothetical protein